MKNFLQHIMGELFSPIEKNYILNPEWFNFFYWFSAQVNSLQVLH
ncbi:hypothetical protein SAMN02745866_02841 [Alteromonadaceae bacterium Bs31]|nr:hypothetical protein SAMN02745866_02841 [Alteromonadaceae bacterium Bs31]